MLNETVIQNPIIEFEFYIPQQGFQMPRHLHFQMTLSPG